MECMLYIKWFILHSWIMPLTVHYFDHSKSNDIKYRSHTNRIQLLVKSIGNEYWTITEWDTQRLLNRIAVIFIIYLIEKIDSRKLFSFAEVTVYMTFYYQDVSSRQSVICAIPILLFNLVVYSLLSYTR